MKGFRTYIVAFLMAMVLTALTYFANFDWPRFFADMGVPQQWIVPLSGLAGALVMAAMRTLTTSPPAQK